MTSENAALRARVAELEADLDLPPKRPGNSSTPPSRGHKAAGEESKPSEGKRRKPHAGRGPHHPDPTAKRDVFASACRQRGAFFLDTPQFVCEAYDHNEIEPIVPDVTRVSLLGGACPCCAGKFNAEPPQDMPKGSPFGSNLRALVIYLRFTRCVAFERSAALLSDRVELDISVVRQAHHEGRARQHARRGDCSYPRRAPRRNHPEIPQDRPAGRPAKLAAVGGDGRRFRRA